MSDFIKNGYIIPYNRNLKERARTLRNNATEWEKKLWSVYLRGLDIHFYRQKPIDNYIVDFYSPKLKLVIEIDGDSHRTDDAIGYDRQRTAVLNSYGLTVIRLVIMMLRIIWMQYVKRLTDMFNGMIKIYRTKSS